MRRLRYMGLYTLCSLPRASHQTPEFTFFSVLCSEEHRPKNETIQL